MEGKIIIIDGVSNSGKTTLCNNLQNIDNILVEEVPNFVRNNKSLFNGKDMPPIPKNREEELKNQLFIFNAEIERIKRAYYIVKCGKNAILDRSFLSTLSIAYSFDKCKKMDGTYLNALLLFKEYIKFIKNLRLENNIDYIFLVSDVLVVEKRNQSRDKMLSKEWIDKSLIEEQNKFFISQKNFCEARIIDTTYLKQQEVLDLVDEKQKEKRY